MLNTILRWLASLWTTAAADPSAERRAELNRLDAMRADTSWLSHDAWAAKWQSGPPRDRAL
jgi:hypothetical protein